MATGAIAGGLLGGLIGALVGNRDDASRNVLIGATTGALVGGTTGYYTERQKQISDDRARIASYAGDIDHSTGEIDRSISSARAAQSCYQREFTSLLNARKAKKISASEGRLRLAEIVSGLKETNELMAAVDGRVGESINIYTKAYEKDLQTVGVQRHCSWPDHGQRRVQQPRHGRLGTACLLESLMRERGAGRSCLCSSRQVSVSSR